MMIRSNDRIFICGKTGTGKTTAAKDHLINNYVKKIFWDIKCENSDLLKKGALLCTTPAALFNKIKMGKSYILYQPNDLDNEDFNKICEIIYKFGNWALVVDEAAEICSPSYITSWHKTLMIRGRSRGVGVVNITQRPRSCNNTIISEAEHFFIFKLFLDTDIGKLSGIFPSGELSDVQNLPYYTCKYIGLDGNVQTLDFRK